MRAIGWQDEAAEWTPARADFPGEETCISAQAEARAQADRRATAAIRQAAARERKEREHAMARDRAGVVAARVASKARELSRDAWSSVAARARAHETAGKRARRAAGA